MSFRGEWVILTGGRRIVAVSGRTRVGMATLLIAALAALAATSLLAQEKQSAAPAAGPAVLEIEGKVDVSVADSATWTPARTNQALRAGDRVRTGERSRAVVRLSNLSLVRLSEHYIFSVPAAAPSGDRGKFNLRKGMLYFFHRDKPGTYPVQTPTAYAVIIGTEFSLEIADDGTTTLHLVDGHVEMTNEFGRLELKSGQSARVEPGKAPAPTAALAAANAVQWCLYYPGILDPTELTLTPAEEQALADSLTSYRQGDLQEALARYPSTRQPASESENIYLAALLLAVGQVEGSEKLLDTIPSNETSRASQLANALRLLIAAVKFQTRSAGQPRQLATSLLAESYYAQSQYRIEEALAHAKAAAARSTNFGYAWARIAELEFSFGRRRQAMAALDQAQKLSPRNAQAAALRGFLLAAENRTAEAIRAFDEAIALDGALGNAWLGRGLCRIRQGKEEEGRQDLQVAVMVEPQRAVLRSYLGKSFVSTFDAARAQDELRLAREFDPNDPTAWLYSALLNRQQNRPNEAVRDLQKAVDLGDRRGVYRSRLLLEQDRAVAGVNRALLFQDVGMATLAAREAGRAVDADAANYAAHQFLGQSYQAQRDLRGLNQRFETAAVSEFLLANLLSPVGAGTLAQSVSSQEYSKLFESDGLGLASSTEYNSNGDWLQSAAQYGTFGNFGYALSAYYRSDNGWRPNNDLEQKEFSAQFKQQVTPQDSIYFRAIYGEADGGDLLARYDPADANTGLRFSEEQEPLLLAGYHREWAPGSHSLVLGGWFRDDLRVRNPEQGVLVLGHDNTGAVTDIAPISIEQKYRNEAEFFTAEAQHIWQGPKTELIVGGRFQGGELDTQNHHTNAGFVFPFLFPTDVQKVSTDFERWSAYAYSHWQVLEPLRLVAGLSYDSLKFPANFRFAPISNEEEHDDQFSPKAGFVWTPTKRTVGRFAYSKSLGGVGFENSFRLEPTQVAGFNQAFRSAVPESVAGANVDAPFETWAASLEQQFGSGTFVALSAELLESDFRRQVGVYDFAAFQVARGSTTEKLDFEESALALTLNQLVGNEWSFGARYRLSRATLEDHFSDLPASAATLGGFRVRSEVESVLHRIDLAANYNHSSGFFGRFESLWFQQSNQGYSPDRPGDDFWQFNVFAGWRFLHRRIEARVGVLNLTDRDYKLNPLNLTPELPRERTFTAGLRFSF